MTQDWARPVVHWELRAKDPQKQREFYSSMFNWNISDGIVLGIPAGIGGPEDLTGHIAPGTPGFTLMIQVLDIEASLKRAVELGGAVTMQPFNVPQGDGVLTLAAITDPEGNPVALAQQ
jgi:predicted enzyme related to lactoylglutathione lyase